MYELFPTTLLVGFDFSILPVYNVEVAGQPELGITQRNLLSPYGALHTITLRTDGLKAEEEALYRFYCARRGGWDPFSMYDPSIDKLWCDVYLGIGAAVETTFDLKGKNTTGHVFTAAGADPGAFSISAGAGEHDQDQVEFTAAPTGIIKAEFTGSRYFKKCYFAQKGLDRKRFEFALYTLGVVIQEEYP